MREKLLSLQSCGESLEKAIAVHYTSLKENSCFYAKYKTLIMYGHNLPKKNHSLDVHGTIGFYSSFLSDLSFIPECNTNYLLERRKEILDQLLHQGVITERNCIALLCNSHKYLSFIRKIPFEYLYSSFSSHLREKSQELLQLELLCPLYVEENWLHTAIQIQTGYTCYSIFSLDIDGSIGKHNLPCDTRAYGSLAKNLSSKPVLSGNSAFLLDSIGHRIGKKTIVGYRDHKRSPRPNRDYALSKLLSNHNSVIEPSNHALGKIFNSLSREMESEEYNNTAFAIAFRRFLDENRFALNL